MLVKGENFNISLRKITLIFLLFAMLLAAYLNSLGIEPFEMEYIPQTEWDKISEKADKERYENALDRIKEDKASDKDHEFVYEYLQNHMVCESNSGNSRETEEKSGNYEPRGSNDS